MVLTVPQTCAISTGLRGPKWKIMLQQSYTVHTLFEKKSYDSLCFIHVAARKGCISSLVPFKLYILQYFYCYYYYHSNSSIPTPIWWTIIHHYHPMLCINSCISLFRITTKPCTKSTLHGCDFWASRPPSVLFVHSCSHSSASIWCWVVQCDPPGQSFQTKKAGNEISFTFSLRREGAYDINFFWISDVIFKKGFKKIVKSRLHPSGQRSFVLSISCLQRMFIALTCSVCCVRAIPVSAARHKSGRCALVEHPIIARKKTGPMMLWPTFGPFIRILPWNNRSSVQSEYMVAYCAFITVLVV